MIMHMIMGFSVIVKYLATVWKEKTEKERKI